jgi:hypothetical protein
MEPAATPTGVVLLIALWTAAHALNFLLPVSCVYVDMIKTVEIRRRRAVPAPAPDPETAPLADIPASVERGATMQVHRKFWDSHHLYGILVGFLMAWAGAWTLVTIIMSLSKAYDATDPVVVADFANTWIPVTAILGAGVVVATHKHYKFPFVMAIVNSVGAIAILFAHRRERGSTDTTFEGVTMWVNVAAMVACAVVVGAILNFAEHLHGPLITGLGFGFMIGMLEGGWSILLWGVIDDYLICLTVGAAIVVVTWFYEQCVFKHVARFMANRVGGSFWIGFWEDVAATQGV